MKPISYTSEVCSHCSQSMTYILAVDKGTVMIVKAIAQFIGRKGINIVHPRKEMEGRYLTSNQVGNLTRARSQGLIAAMKGNPGNYCLTSKGATFLRGEAIPKFAIISKSEKRQIGYFEPEKHMVIVKDFTSSSEMWEGIDYEIQEGRVIRERQPTLI